MRILITGAQGMLGTDLCLVLEENHEVIRVDLDQFDITDTQATFRYLEEEEPEMVIHCAASADVDGCERDPDLAFKTNAFGTWNVAAAAAKMGAIMAYLSTDYVFSGQKQTAYHEFDQPNPINVYGATKLAGERMVRSLCARHFIIRSSWLYGLAGKNFAATMLKLGKEKTEAKVVADQRGCPTYTRDLAEGISRLIDSPLYGTYHLTSSVPCSWQEFAQAIFEIAGMEVELIPISYAEWDSPTQRPANSVLDNMAWRLLDYPPLRSHREALAEFVPACLAQMEAEKYAK